MEKKEFIKQVKPYANKVGKDLDIDPDIIVAHWAHETGYGRNTGFKNNNLSGIMAYKGSPYGINGKKYSTLNDYCTDYERVLSNKRYNGIRGQRNPTEFAKVLKAGGYAEDSNYAYAPTWVEAFNLAKDVEGDPNAKVSFAEGGSSENSTEERSGVSGYIDQIFDNLKFGVARIIIFTVMIVFLYFAIIHQSKIENGTKQIVKQVKKVKSSAKN